MIDAARLSSPPRHVRLTGKYVTARNISIAIAVSLWLGILALLLHLNAQDEDLAAHGVSATGTVVNERKISGKGESYYLTVSYSLKDRYDTQEFSVSKVAFDLQPIGSRINITVDPKDVQHSRIGSYQKDDADSSLLYRMLAMAGTAALIGLFIYAETSIASTEVKRLSTWTLGALNIEHLESVDRAGMTISGHYTLTNGTTREASIQNYSGSVHVAEQIPILYNDLGSDVVSLKSLKRVEVING